MPLTMLIRLFLRTGAGSPFNPVAPRRAFTSFLHWAGDERLLVERGFSPRFSPDGVLLAYGVSESAGSQIYIAPASGGPATKIAPGFYLVRAPVWSPDGNALLFWGQRDRDAPPENNVDWYVSDLKGAPIRAGRAVRWRESNSRRSMGCLRLMRGRAIGSCFTGTLATRRTCGRLGLLRRRGAFRRRNASHSEPRTKRVPPRRRVDEWCS